jgi:cell division protein YceG involved in septum cleavage
MKKLLTANSYTLLLILVSCLSALFIYLSSNSNEDDYIKVTVTAGDTIWEIADQYTNDSFLTKKQFINWVLTQNEINEKQIYPGDQLILPVKNSTINMNTELASAIGE